jgi:hypothetical protein
MITGRNSLSRRGKGSTIFPHYAALALLLRRARIGAAAAPPGAGRLHDWNSLL